MSNTSALLGGAGALSTGIGSLGASMGIIALGGPVGIGLGIAGAGLGLLGKYSQHEELQDQINNLIKDLKTDKHDAILNQVKHTNYQRTISNQHLNNYAMSNDERKSGAIQGMFNQSQSQVQNSILQEGKINDQYNSKINELKAAKSSFDWTGNSLGAAANAINNVTTFQNQAKAYEQNKVTDGLRDQYNQLMSSGMTNRQLEIDNKRSELDSQRNNLYNAYANKFNVDTTIGSLKSNTGLASDIFDKYTYRDRYTLDPYLFKGGY